MNHATARRLTPATALSCIVLATTPAIAQSTARWIGPADAPLSVTTSWWDERNWENFTAPGPGDSAVLGWDPSLNTDPAAYVYFGDFRAIGESRVVSGGTASIDTLELQSGGFVFDFRSFNVPGGSDGTLVSNRIRLGAEVESTGFGGFAGLRLIGGLARTGALEVGASDGVGSGHLRMEGASVDVMEGASFVRGSVELLDGAQLTTGATGRVSDIGAFGQECEVVMCGSSTMWSHSNTQFWIGHGPFGGRGALRISEGASLDIHNNALLVGNGGTGGWGEIRLSGSGSSLTASSLLLGDSEVDVSGSARLDAGSFASIGTYADDDARVRVRGIDSSLAASNEISVGREGTGSLVIEDGAGVSSRYVNVGAFATGNGSIEVDGHGSRLGVSDEGENPSGELSIGRSGAGSLRVANGGEAAARFANAGVFAGGDGRILVDGTGSSLLIDDFLVVGSEQGRGRVEGTNGASIVVGPTGGSIYVDTQDAFSIDPASTALVGTASPQAGALVVGSGGQLIGAGTITGDVVNYGGYIGHDSLGRSLSIDGDLRLGQGLLGIAVGDPAATLIVSGAAELGGALVIHSLDKATISPGQEFALLLAGSITGSFDHIDDQTPFGFDIVYRENGAYLIATAPAPGALPLAAACALTTRRRRHSRAL